MAPSNQSESATHPNRIPRSEALQRLLNGDSGAIPPTRETAIEALVTVALRRRNDVSRLSAVDAARLVQARLHSASRAETMDRWCRTIGTAPSQGRFIPSLLRQKEEVLSAVERLELEILGPLPPPPTESEVNALLGEYVAFRQLREKPTRERPRDLIRAERFSQNVEEK